MARADLLCDLIKSGLAGEDQNFRKAAEAICAEERAKQHVILAKKIEELLETHSRQPQRREAPPQAFNVNGSGVHLFHEITPEKCLEQLILSDAVIQSCNELVEEQMRADLLRSYGVEPRNKILLVGPPGNGKTSLAEAIATSLMLPMYVVKYEAIIGAYLGETASKLAKLFEYVKTRQCVLFFDEFETLGKERGDRHETGEIKRVVSSLLLQIDALPSYVVIIAATNHDALLDKAAWRRFQIKLELKKPSRRNLEVWFTQFEKRANFRFGLEVSTLAKKMLGTSYAEAEDFALAVYRQYILQAPKGSTKSITLSQLKLHTLHSPNDAIAEEVPDNG
jgi:AAA+ superfamily predicted ATPase